MTDKEKDLINGCKRGIPAYQEQFYHEYGPMIKGICYRYTGYETEDSKDLFHDVVVHILTHIGNYKEVSSLTSWVYRTTVNKCIDHYRAMQLRKTASTDEYEIDYPEPSRPNDTLSMEQLVTLINQLSPNQRMVFNLHVVDGYSQEEVTKMLGLTQSNVRTLISRSKESLRKKIKDYLGKEIEIL